MRKYYDNMYDEENPSSNENIYDQGEKFTLPTDQAAENLIKIKGLTTEDLIDNHFQGIDLMTYDGTPFSRTFLVSSLNSAIDRAEQVFDICITPREIKDELHDFEGNSLFDSYQYTPLFKRPVREIESITYKMGNKKILKIPKEWIQLDKRVGDVTIFPTTGSVNYINPAIGVAVPYFMTRSYMPMAISINYKAGMEKEEIPHNLLDWIFKYAAITIFEVWGDQIIGAGIASSSVSIDGLSQSIGTTQSAMYGGASARILEYRKDLEELTPIIRKYFARFDSVVL
ncbi:hypothetical protein [Anaerococcus sp. Marseille-P3625]|uniref:hypothetical protein n=1 Tax=Anaerococcus sp. Marseille-P3625 TaxID=1977277 RepID=UPI000C076A2E|nr:hypothetical protein [Anaerococcus sp. Marseille-P3625]